MFVKEKEHFMGFSMDKIKQALTSCSDEQFDQLLPQMAKELAELPIIPPISTGTSKNILKFFKDLRSAVKKETEEEVDDLLRFD